jgi:hypothetical protein
MELLELRLENEAERRIEGLADEEVGTRMMLIGPGLMYFSSTPKMLMFQKAHFNNAAIIAGMDYAYDPGPPPEPQPAEPAPTVRSRRRNWELKRFYEK